MLQRMRKRGISAMVSYVLMISIALIVAVGVYVWVQSYANVSAPIDCPDGTTLQLEDIVCTREHIDLTFRNSGRFSIDGVIVAVTNDSNRAPTTYLIPVSAQQQLAGQNFFVPSLQPGESKVVSFLTDTREGDVTFSEIVRIHFQPFIFDNQQKELCSEAVVVQDVVCNLG